MAAMELIAVSLLSYLFGSISFARIVTRIWSGKDVTKFKEPIEGEDEAYEALSIGANIVSSKLGSKAGMVVSFLDILKVAIPTFVAKRMFPASNWAPIVASIFGMAGHIWPVYYRFHGGVGFSSIMGGLLILDPIVLLITPFLGIILGLVIFKNMVVATLSWLWLLIPWFLITKFDQAEFIIYAVVVNILFSLAMIPEIKIRMQLKKEGKSTNYMASNPMGRGYLKMAKALGFMKDDEPVDDAAE